MNERRITLADVARKAGVHVTTVSLALRNHPRLPEATRSRIRKLAERMGYRPDPFLQALAAYRGRTSPRRNPPTLAYVTNWQTRFGWKSVTGHNQFHLGAQAKAAELGYHLEHFWMGEPGLTQARLSQILKTRSINGLIIASHKRELDVALQFDWSRFSAVKIDYFPHEPGLHNVTNNQCSIIRLAMRHLIAAGYKRIGFVMHRGWDHGVDLLWTAGFLCEQSKLPEASRIPMLLFPDAEPIDEWILDSKIKVVADTGMFERWYNQHRPEVIISKQSFIQPCLNALGLRVPQDVAFADLFVEETNGRLAGVRQNHEQVGALAVEILAGQLHHHKFGVPDIPTTTFVEGTWFDGASCPPRK